ncbi:MAG: GNAT family N-acetyltransferase [Oscillospiraceae bacterium]|nr:GNAT family N-acetyltransferase [Oscillospiraceae bacterium]
MIETERLIIRKLVETDLPEYERTLNDAMLSFMGPKEFLNWFISQYAEMDIQNSIICFGMFDKTTGVLLGTVGAGRHDDLHEPEIFYALLPESRGKGFATEATKAVIDWVFEHYKIPYLIATAGIDNIKSQKVLERCGFQFISVKNLLVHIKDKKYDFKYYRYYPTK